MQTVTPRVFLWLLDVPATGKVCVKDGPAQTIAIHPADTEQEVPEDAVLPVTAY